jgi:hypothetical protein
MTSYQHPVSGMQKIDKKGLLLQREIKLQTFEDKNNRKQQVYIIYCQFIEGFKYYIFSTTFPGNSRLN